MNVWQILTTVLFLLSIGGGSEQCTNSEDGTAKAGDSCGCGATSRKISAASVDSTKTSSMEVESNEESPSHKYSEEANVNQGLPRTNQMVHIPGGKFVMGTNDPVFTADGEQPARWVEIDGFYMDVYEVSNAEFQLFVLANNYVTEVCGLDYY